MPEWKAISEIEVVDNPDGQVVGCLGKLGTSLGCHGESLSLPIGTKHHAANRLGAFGKMAKV